MEMLNQLARHDPIMLSLHLVAIVGLAALFELSVLWMWRSPSGRSTASLQQKQEDHTVSRLQNLTRPGRRSGILSRVFKASDNGRDLNRATLVGRETVRAFDHPIAILGWTVAIAPLLGILGTAAGIAKGFGGGSTVLPDPAVVASGIALALRTTIWGLSISIVAATARFLFVGVRARIVDAMNVLLQLLDDQQDKEKRVAQN